MEERKSTAELLEAWREATRAAEMADSLAANASDVSARAEDTAVIAEEIAKLAEQGERRDAMCSGVRSRRGEDRSPALRIWPTLAGGD